MYIKIDANNKALYKKSPLIYACEANSIEIVRLLLQEGADPNLECEKPVTALMAAVIKVFLMNCIKNKGNIEICNELLDKKANPILNCLENSAISQAAIEGNINILELILKNYNLTKQEVSRLLAKYRQITPEIREFLFQNSTDPIKPRLSLDLINTQANLEEFQLEQAQTPQNFINKGATTTTNRETRKKIHNRKVRPFSAHKPINSMNGLGKINKKFPMCEGKKIDFNMPKRTNSKERNKKSLDSPILNNRQSQPILLLNTETFNKNMKMRLKTTEQKTVKKLKSQILIEEIEKKQVARNQKKMKPQNADSGPILKFENSASSLINSTYYKYLSPENGHADINFTVNPMQATKIIKPEIKENLKSQPEIVKLTPMSQLLDVSPKSKQAQRLFKAIAKNTPTISPSPDKRKINPENSLSKPLISNDYKKSISSRNDGSPNPEKRSKTVLSKYGGKTHIESMQQTVEEEESPYIESPGMLYGSKFDAIEEKKEDEYSGKKKKHMRKKSAKKGELLIKKFNKSKQNQVNQNDIYKQRTMKKPVNNAANTSLSLKKNNNSQNNSIINGQNSILTKSQFLDNATSLKRPNTAKNNNNRIINKNISLNSSGLNSSRKPIISNVQVKISASTQKFSMKPNLEKKFAELFAMQYTAHNPLNSYFKNSSSDSRLPHEDIKNPNHIKLVNLLSNIKNSVTSLQTYRFAKTKFFNNNNKPNPISVNIAKKSGSTLKGKIPLLMVTNSMKHGPYFKINNEREKNFYP